MSKHYRQWRLIIPAALITTVAVTLWAGITHPERDSPLGAWLVQVASSPHWERAASITQVIGLVAAIGALIYARNSLAVARGQLKAQLDDIQREQERIADEITRRPKVTVELAGHRDGVMRYPARRVPGNSDLAWAVMRFWVSNDGGRTARNVGVNITLAPGIAGKGFDSMLKAAGVDPRRALVSDDTSFTWIDISDAMNFEKNGLISRAIIFSELNVEYEVQFQTSWDDSPPAEFSFFIGAFNDPRQLTVEWPRRLIPAT